MATYKTYQFNMPNSYKDYMPAYNTYSYKKPSETYSDANSPYASDINRAQNNLNNVERNKPGAYNSQYSDQIDSLINTLSNRKFSYDVNTDPLYQQYKTAYMNQGKQAMQDTIGQASAMTGGYGNSYATAAGNQAYNSYLDQLNNMYPELYQLALSKYTTEGNDLQNLYTVLANQESSDYGKYRDKVSDYQTDRGYYDTQLQNLRTMGQNLWGQNWDNYWNAADRTDTNYNNALNAALSLYGTAWDNYQWGEEQTQKNYEQAVSEDQWLSEFNEDQRQFNETNAYNNAKLNADTDYNNSYLEYLNSKGSSGSSSSNSSSSGSSSSGSSGNYGSSTNVKNFLASIMTKSEFTHRGNSATVDGVTYNNYKQYANAVAAKWYNADRLNENEARYIKGLYS